MIVTKLPLKIYASGRDMRWKRGMLNVKKEDMDLIGWREQEVIVVLLRPDEEIDAEALKRKVGDFNKVVKMEEELDEIKKETSWRTDNVGLGKKQD